MCCRIRSYVTLCILCILNIPIKGQDSCASPLVRTHIVILYKFFNGAPNIGKVFLNPLDFLANFAMQKVLFCDAFCFELRCLPFEVSPLFLHQFPHRIIKRCHSSTVIMSPLMALASLDLISAISCSSQQNRLKLHRYYHSTYDKTFDGSRRRSGRCRRDKVESVDSFVVR